MELYKGVDYSKLGLSLPRNTCHWDISKTNTFRTGSRALFARSKSFMGLPTFKGYGTNLQNIEKEMRSIYVAEPGKVLVQVDQSGAEALIVSYLCRKGRYRDLFLHGVKPHVFVALHNFLDTWKIKCKGIDVDTFVRTEIKELRNLPQWETLDKMIKASDNWAAHERYYYIAKMICHASNYGMRAAAFQVNVLEKSKGTIVLSKQQAEEYLTNYHSLFPEIHEWHRQVEYQLEQTRILYNLFGYPREFTEFSDQMASTIFKEAYAFPAQSTVGCITHIAISNLHKLIRKEKLPWDILINTHDGCVAQCPEDQTLECAKAMKDSMEQELTSPRGEKFRMKAEVMVGRNWGPYKEDKNPDGLKEVKL